MGGYDDGVGGGGGALLLFILQLLRRVLVSASSYLVDEHRQFPFRHVLDKNQRCNKRGLAVDRVRAKKLDKCRSARLWKYQFAQWQRAFKLDKHLDVHR